MWKLTIEDDEGQRTSLDLNQGEYSIGRGEETDIRLTERNISRKHCLIRKVVDQAPDATESPETVTWEIVDDGSYNGTYVNGERVTAEGTVLSSGDVINIGDYRIELLDASDQLDAEEAPQRRPDRLVMVIGPTPGMEYSLTGDRLGIGRAEEAFMSINHASVSRMHAELHNLGHGRWEVVDQGSSNGIRINGVELRRGIIEPGDALELGDVRLRFVAAGKFFRPAVDLSQQLPALPFEGMTASAGPAQTAQRSMGVIFAAVAIVSALLVAGWAMFSGSGDTAPAAPRASAPVDDAQAEAILAEAKKYADGGDMQKAHKQIDRIPEESSVRESEELQAIEDKWADEMFAKAEQSQDPDDKILILTLISDAVSVTTEKRKEAARRALEVNPIDNLDDPDPPRVPFRPPIVRPATSATPAGSAPTIVANPRLDPEPESPTPEEPDPPGKPKFDPKANKQRLYNKVASGNASESEIRQLKALCMLDGDRACRAMAVGALKAHKNK